MRTFPLAHAVAVGAFMFGTIPVPILVDAPASTAQMSVNKPHTPIDCVPVGVTTKPDGSVWAVENCNGDEIHYRLPTK